MSERRTTAQRGYGGAHQRRRKLAAPIVATGTVRCWRCGELIEPDEPWDLGHDDEDRSITRGPEHVDCNRGTGAAGRRPTRRRPAEQHPGLVGGVPRRRRHQP